MRGKNAEHTEDKRMYFAKSAVSVHLLADKLDSEEGRRKASENASENARQNGFNSQAK